MAEKREERRGVREREVCTERSLNDLQRKEMKERENMVYEAVKEGKVCVQKDRDREDEKRQCAKR